VAARGRRDHPARSGTDRRTLDFAPHHVADQFAVSAHKVGVMIIAHVGRCICRRMAVFTVTTALGWTTGTAGAFKAVQVQLSLKGGVLALRKETVKRHQ
jgi:hypothetical protein